MAFGRKNRPQTPVKGIISNEYGTEAAENINNKYEQMAEERSGKKRNAMQTVSNTRARMLAIEHIRTVKNPT